jgi:hypothetical protein
MDVHAFLPGSCHWFARVTLISFFYLPTLYTFTTMPSKGVDFYGFVADGYELELRKADAGNKDNPDVVQNEYGRKPLGFFSKHYEINTNHWALRYEGKFQFIAKKDGKPLFERSLRVNGDTGNINDEDLANIQVPSRTEDDYSLSFGLYDSDNTDPNAHQLYACLTPNRKTWQSDFFDTIIKSEYKFKDMVLPGSHDAGMYKKIFAEASNMANTQKDSVDKQLELGARYFDYRPGIVGSNFTQLLTQAKDNSNIFLALLAAVGVVLMPFFGPGVFVLIGGLGFAALIVLKGKIKDLISYVNPKLNEISHVHAVIPGESLNEFIGKITDFLENNKKEIVVINIVDSGIIRSLDIPKGSVKQFIPDSAKKYIPEFLDIVVPDIIIDEKVKNGTSLDLISVPTKEVLLEKIKVIIGSKNIIIGDSTTLEKTISEILSSHQRLIIFFQKDKVISNDSYGDAYLTYDPSVITDSIDKTLNRIDFSNLKEDEKPVFTKLQLQLTPTGTSNGIWRAIKGSDTCTSPLFATKPRTDLKSYQYLLANAKKVKAQNKMVAIQNDFYDNALTEVALALNKFNAGQIKYFPISPTDNLTTDKTLHHGEYLTDRSGYFQLIFQEDGNLVMYDIFGNAHWNTGTQGKGASRAIMQTDGNLVLYKANNDVVWAANRDISNFRFVQNARLTIQEDGNLVMYEPNNTVIWALF